MLYDITRPFAKIALGLYFRKIYLVNAHVLPKDKPIILAANHPTAFIEPCILACWLEKPLSFVARGDLYMNNTFLRKLYDWYRMTPIFRLEDTGYGNLTSNYDTFRRCFNILKQNKTLMILVEGRTLHEKRLRPVRKGTARIVFSALENVGDLDIHIVPVGVNYTDSDSFRSIAMIEFAEPIRCSDYNALYKKQPAKAIKELTSEMGKRLKNKVIHIEDEKADSIANTILELFENEVQTSFFPVSSQDNKLFTKQKNVTNQINDFSDEQKEQLKIEVEEYHSQLSKLNISDVGLVKRSVYSFFNSMLVFILFIPALIGLLLNWPPILIGNYLAKKISPSIEFRAATAIVFSSFLYLFYGIGLYAAGFLMGFGWKTFLLVSIPIMGIFYVYFNDFRKKWAAAKGVSKLSKDTIADLLKRRDTIQSFFSNS